MTTNDVVLHVYDLSFGLAKPMSKDLLGISLEGVWHTSIVVFGYEYFYGKSLQRKEPEVFLEMFGSAPVKKISLGATSKQKRQFEGALLNETFQKQFSPNNYSILNHNCNHFCREALALLFDDTSKIITEEVGEIFNNSEIIANCPSAGLVQGLIQNASGMLGKIFDSKGDGSGMFGQNIREKLETAREGEVEGDDDEDAADSDDEEEVRQKPSLENKTMTINPEALILGFVDFFEGFTATAGQENRRRSQALEEAEPPRRRPANRDVVIPPEASQAARHFGMNLVEAINMVNSSVAAALEMSKSEEKEKDAEKETVAPPSNSRNNSKNTALDALRHKSSTVFEEKGGVVPVRADMREFLAGVFDSKDEDIVQRTVLNIFEKEGYYSLGLLKGVTEAELLQMGVKRGWAKKLKLALDRHFEE